MRGLGMKLFRALLMFQIVNKVLRITPEKRLRRLQSLRDEQAEDLADTDKMIEGLLNEIESQYKL